MNELQRFCYVAYAPCGCIAGAVIDEPRYASDVGRSVSEFVRDGNRIERQPMPVQLGGDCPHTPKWGKSPQRTSSHD